MKYMIRDSESILFVNTISDAIREAFSIANNDVTNLEHTSVIVKDIDSSDEILRLYVGGGEIRPFFMARTLRRSEYFPECKFGHVNGPVSYFIEKFDVSRKFAEKYIASKDGRVVAMSSDIFDLDGELRIGCIELPVSIMHICEDGTIENYEYNGDKE